MYKWEYKKIEYSNDVVEEHCPTLLPDIFPCIDRLEKAIFNDEIMEVIGDYDSDGMNSTNIFQRAIKDVGGRCKAYIPERVEGYGANENQVNRAVKDGATLIIMIDNGSSAFKAINRCKELNVDLIIIDHHNIPNQSAVHAVAFVNPKRVDSIYPFKEVCATLLTYKVAQLLYDRFNFPVDYAKDRFLDFVAVGTIGDQMPLIGENRFIVMEGLAKANEEPSTHMRALANTFRLNTIDTYAVNFKIVPSINSASRLGDAKSSYAFLFENNKDDIKDKSKVLKDFNDKRIELKEIAIKNIVLERDDFPVIYYHSDVLDHGIMGLIASYLTDKYKKPSFVSCKDHGRIKGSARSCNDFKIYDYLMDFPEHLFVARGGHDQALGFELVPCEMDNFKNHLYSTNPLVGETIIYYNFTLNDPINQFGDLKYLEPFGQGFPKPTFLCEDFEVSWKRYYGDSGKTFGNGYFKGKQYSFSINADMRNFSTNRLKGVVDLQADRQGELRIHFVDYELIEQ